MRADQTSDDNVNHIASDVFNRAFAGELSQFAFLLGLLCVHYGPNRHFYPAFSPTALSPEAMTVLVVCSCVAIVLEAVNFVALEVLFRRRFGFSVSATGLPFYQSQYQARIVVVMFLVHYMQDVYVAQLGFTPSPS
jgi:hypothetical protein